MNGRERERERERALLIIIQFNAYKCSLIYSQELDFFLPYTFYGLIKSQKLLLTIPKLRILSRSLQKYLLRSGNFKKPSNRHQLGMKSLTLLAELNPHLCLLSC